jgi:hypothetical protein
MRGVIDSSSKQSAVDSCTHFLRYYPFRYAAIVDMDGQWGYCTGKTKARMNRLVREGHKVYMLTKS